MGIADRLLKLENGSGDASWAAMCTAFHRDHRHWMYGEAVRLAAELGAAVELPEPPEPEPAALRAFERTYGSQMKQDTQGERFLVAKQRLEALTPRERLDRYIAELAKPETEYRMVA